MKDKKPSAAFEIIDSEMGGVTAGSTGKLPCSKARLSDIRKRLFKPHHTDELALMMKKCKCLKKDGVPLILFVLCRLPSAIVCLGYRYTIKVIAIVMYRSSQFQRALH